jgi:hypothetical protein
MGFNDARSWSPRRPGSIGRTHVDHQIVSTRRQNLRARNIIVDGIGGGRELVLSNIHADDREGATARSQAVQPLGNFHRPVIVETHAVDEGFIVGQAEKTRGIVPRLRQRCDGTNLHVPKSQGMEATDRHRVFVEPGCESQR